MRSKLFFVQNDVLWFLSNCEQDCPGNCKTFAVDVVCTSGKVMSKALLSFPYISLSCLLSSSRNSFIGRLS